MLKLFGKSSQEDWLIAGLGNPEPKYDGTRHNAGFAALDELARRWDVPVTKAKFQGLYGIAQQGERKVYLLKPMTYMDQQPGKLRIRPQGSAGGHNGLKSIIASLSSQEFNRIRIGVGKKPSPEYDLADWVLGRFSAEDKKAIEGRWDDLEKACQLIMEGKLGEAQNRYNR